MESLIVTGKELFWKYGIKRVSIEEICKESGVSKMTFYKFFPNKVELARTILRLVMDKALIDFQKLIDSDCSFKEKVHQMFVMKLEGTKDISAEFIKDVYHNLKPGLMEEMEGYSKESFQLFVDFLKEAQAKGRIRKEVKIEFILSYMNQMTQMINDDALMTHYDTPQDLIMESMNFLFYGLLPREL
ncbi:MAG: TetR/AcrR family transcriptional regulator [Marinilabiliaceae bacterium]|nr:TetR/AcrR family transcriptional regulator [Marinilabiliaceae bacterium]